MYTNPVFTSSDFGSWDDNYALRTEDWVVCK